MGFVTSGPPKHMVTIRSFVLCLGALAWLGQADQSELLAGLRQVLPEDVGEKVAQLTAADFRSLQDFLKSLADPQSLARNLDQSSPAIRDLVKLVAKRLDRERLKLAMKLKPDTKVFLNNSKVFFVERLTEFGKDFAKVNDTVKEDLRKNFPRLMLFLENPKSSDQIFRYCGYGGYMGGGYGGYGGGVGGYGTGYGGAAGFGSSTLLGLASAAASLGRLIG